MKPGGIAIHSMENTTWGAFKEHVLESENVNRNV